MLESSSSSGVGLGHRGEMGLGMQRGTVVCGVGNGCRGGRESLAGVWGMLLGGGCCGEGER